MEEFARSVGGVLICLWDSEEKKGLTESDRPSRKHPATDVKADAIAALETFW
jgi:hypothetical protein